MIIETGRSVNSNNKEGMDKKGPITLPTKPTAAKKVTKTKGKAAKEGTAKEKEKEAEPTAAA